MSSSPDIKDAAAERHRTRAADDFEEGLCRAVIVLTMHNERQFVESAIAAGIRGYVLKIEASDELVLAVRTVLSGGIYLSRGVRR